MKVSPAFASFVKGVPGFDIAVDWLTHVRERDGVQTAINNGYTPNEPVTWQTGGTTITIGDMYLTDEELLFKSFIRSDDFDATDPRSAVHLSIHPVNLTGGGSTTDRAVIPPADGGQKPILQVTYKYRLREGAVRDFLAKETELRLAVVQNTSYSESRRDEWKELGSISVPVQASKLLHNRVVEPKLKLAVGDPDIGELTLEKLTIQPTSMNVVLRGPKDWSYFFPRDDGTAPYLKDDKGNVYRYDPSGPLLPLGDGAMQLPFSSSVFFDPDVRSLTLHIGKLTVGEWEPSDRFELSLEGDFPKTVRFKKESIVVEGADYVPRGYLHLKLKKERPGQTSLEGVSFDIAEKEEMTAKFEKEGPQAYEAYTRKSGEDREAFRVSGFGIAEDYADKAYLDVYIPAPKLERYTVTLSRSNDAIVVDRNYTIPLKP
ncbi:DUF4179 domain-containing protein [Paenibacillus sp. GYB003]|uniref:DUF4179 domain-containing protein n=1 Tax=Paenibacillus sp. GYB003 TaxID=2994392 RepID=UPI002F9639B3